MNLLCDLLIVATSVAAATVLASTWTEFAFVVGVVGGALIIVRETWRT